MTKMFHGKHGVTLEFTFPDDIPPGDVILLSRKVQRIVDALESLDQFEETMRKLGYEPETIDEGSIN